MASTEATADTIRAVTNLKNGVKIIRDFLKGPTFDPNNKVAQETLTKQYRVLLNHKAALENAQAPMLKRILNKMIEIFESNLKKGETGEYFFISGDAKTDLIDLANEVIRASGPM